ncbi:O-methyltransferase [Candidatus Phytoplasma palmae]|uniref:O-methyltransferase n=1 Tax=Candidatus Phytoplasma palmae TaxID=85624 RepID=UPI003990948E
MFLQNEKYLKMKYLKELKKVSIDHKIPIIRDEIAIFLKEIIKKNNFKYILEIGTGIGYSALTMSNEFNYITTIERDYLKYKLAKKFFSNFHCNIDFIWSEALFYQPQIQYDFIFIDCAKAQYQKIFSKYSFFLKKEGFIVCDNLNFQNLSLNDLSVSKRKRRIIIKLKKFKNFLKENNNFHTIFKNIGDGISISRKKYKFF